MQNEAALPKLAPTGHHDIDRVHRRVGENLVYTRAALDRGDRDHAMTCTLALLDCLRADFACEESLMQASAYPETARHVRAHAALEAAFSDIARRIRDADSALRPGDANVLRPALRQVAADLTAHVLKADGALAQFLDGNPPSGKHP
jgi:hemerythrin-like metal-binding protein